MILFLRMRTTLLCSVEMVELSIAFLIVTVSSVEFWFFCLYLLEDVSERFSNEF